MMAASAINYFDRIAMSIAGPAIMQEQGFSAAQLGMAYSAFGAAYTIAMLPAGRLSDRFGPKRMLGMAGLATAVLTAATGLSVSTLLLVRFWMGAFSAPLYPACGKLTANWFSPESIARVQGFVIGAGAGGSAIAPVVFAALMSRFGWRAAFVIAGTITACFFFWWLARVRDFPGKPVEGKARQGGWSRLLRSRPIILLSVSYFCVCYLYHIFDYWTYYYFREVRHMGDGPSALFTTFTQVVAMIMMPLGGWVSDFAGRRVVPILALTLSATLLYAGTLATGTVATVALLALAFGLATSVEGSYWATTMEAGGASEASAYGIVNAAGNLGGFIAPLIVPLVAARLGWAWGLNSAGVAISVAVFCWLWLARAART